MSHVFKPEKKKLLWNQRRWESKVTLTFSSEISSLSQSLGKDVLNIWWFTCRWTVCWPLYATHTYTDTVLDLETLDLTDCLRLGNLCSRTNWVAQPQHPVCMCDAGCSSSMIYTPAMLLNRRCGETQPVKCHCKSLLMKQPSLLLLQTFR